MKENKEYLTEVNFTGQDIAKMVGAEDLYLQGIQEFENEGQMAENTVKDFKNMMKRINESDKKRTNTMFD